MGLLSAARCWSLAKRDMVFGRLVLDDFDAQVGQSIDVHFNHIAAHHRAHVLGRAGVDDVAREQLKGVRESGNLLGHRPDHLVQVGFLLGLAIDLEPNLTLFKVTGLRQFMNGTNGG